jgi:predicted aspartyl protease
MLIRATVNGHAANFIVDTGAAVSVLDQRRARAFGVTPTEPSSRYGQFKILNGQPLRVGLIGSLRAGSMDFGSRPIALQGSTAGNNFLLSWRSLSVDGVFGADILTHYKAVINCQTQQIYFKVDPSRRLELASFAMSHRFIRVPLHEEVGHGFTVPCSINGHGAHLLIDTGTPLTTFNQIAAKSAGISLQPTRLSSTFSDGLRRGSSVGQFNQFSIGNFRVPAQKFATTVLPPFAEQQGNAHIDGILGMELLSLNHAIIDFDSMSLFLR